MNTALLVVFVFTVVACLMYRRSVELERRVDALAERVAAAHQELELLTPDEKRELEEATTSLAQFSEEYMETKMPNDK